MQQANSLFPLYFDEQGNEGLQVCLDSRQFVRAVPLLLSHFHVPLYLSVLASFIPLIPVFNIQQELSKYFCRSRGLCSYYVHDLIFLFFLPSSSGLLLPFLVSLSGLLFLFLCLSPDTVSVCVSLSLSYLLSLFFPSASLVTYLLCVTTCQALG